jgi:hypothetical protein
VKKFLVLSLILHTIVFFWLTFEKKVVQQDIIEIDTKDRSNLPRKENPEGLTGPTGSTGPKRIGNNGEGINDLPLGDKLTAENYIQRIRDLIEPVWIRKVKERVKFRQKNKYPVIKCTTSIIILVNSTGFIEKNDIVLSCSQDFRFDQIALGVWDRNLPPPPKSLLENGMLEIVWNFLIR